MLAQKREGGTNAIQRSPVLTCPPTHKNSLKQAQIFNVQNLKAPSSCVTISTCLLCLFDSVSPVYQSQDSYPFLSFILLLISSRNPYLEKLQNLFRVFIAHFFLQNIDFIVKLTAIKLLYEKSVSLARKKVSGDQWCFTSNP